MDEFGAILKARKFINSAGIDSIPVDLDQLASAANAAIKVSGDMLDSESGQTFPLAGKHIISVNGNHREERQRFTVLHELGHIVLGIPSQHHGETLTTNGLVSYRGRPHEEVLCDVFAAECLLPFQQFKRDIEGLDASFECVRELASRYKASINATGSRFAVNYDDPCAFVLMERGKVRYASMSKYLRERKGWITLGTPIPKGSVAHRLSAESGITEGYDELPVATWFSNGVRGFDVLAEDAILLDAWDQHFSLLWLSDDLRPADSSPQHSSDEEDNLLEELDGVLPWPGKKRRK